MGRLAPIPSPGETLARHREKILDVIDRDEQDFLRRRTGGLDHRRILDEVFDERTIKAIHKLMNDGHLYTLEFPIATGKEASVFVGVTKKADLVAVKVYRIGNATFNSIRKYIAEDPRFRLVRHDKRTVIYTWAMKEYKNLMRMHAAGLPVPKAVKYYENVLIMQYLYVGDNYDPAPPLRTAEGYDAAKVYKTIRLAVRRMVKVSRLVHGDLSEYNIMMVAGKPWIIDVSQALVLDHPHARDYLKRDAENITKFFQKKGIKETADELYAYWTQGIQFEQMTRKERGEEDEDE